MNLNYLAGILDGEGYIGIVKASPQINNGEKHHRYCPRVTVVNTSKVLIDALKNNYLGNIGDRPLVSPRHKKSYSFNFSMTEIKRLLPRVKNKLLIKKRQAELVLALIKTFRPTGRRNSYTTKEFEVKEKIYQETSALNRVGAIMSRIKEIQA